MLTRGHLLDLGVVHLQGGIDPLQHFMSADVVRRDSRVENVHSHACPANMHLHSGRSRKKTIRRADQQQGKTAVSTLTCPAAAL